MFVLSLRNNIISMVIALAGVTSAAATEFTLQDAVKRALENNPERMIAMAQVLQAEASRDAARADYFPQVNGKVEGGREYNDRFALRDGATDGDGYNNSNSASLNIRQLIFDGFITRETVAQRLAQLQASKFNQNKVTEELITSTVEVYMQLREFQQTNIAAQQNLASLQEIAELVTLRREAGDTDGFETEYIQARLANAKQEVINAAEGLSDAKSALEFLVGDIPAFEASIPKLSAFLTVLTSESPQTFLNVAYKNNTDLKVNSREVQAARFALKSSKGKYYPKLNAILDGSHAEDKGGNTGISENAVVRLELTYEFFDGGLRAADVRRNAAKIQELQARRESIRRSVKQGIEQSYNKLKASADEVIIAATEIESNIELERVAKEQFRFGENDLDITNLVEARERIFSAQVKQIRLVSDIINAHFALRQLTGALLTEFGGRV